MATPVGQNAFVPKQAITKDVDLYAEITANSTRDVARAILDFLPPIPANAKIHDNGCGSGEVTSAILERLTTAQDAATAVRGPGVSIEATDIDDSYLDRLRANLHDAHDEQPAEVTVSHMPAEQLAFAADHFDLSIANFVVFLTPEEGLPALRHMHRTLKTGGTAVVTAWARLPHVDPVRAAHLATRAGSAGDVGPDTETHHPGPPPPPLREIPPQWWSGPYLRDAVVRAGFDEGRVALRSVTVSITARDERHLARVLWSYLGPPVTGWLPSDEARWDEAMDVIVHSFGQMEGFQRLEGEGGLRIELTANVVLATK